MDSVEDISNRVVAADLVTTLESHPSCKKKVDIPRTLTNIRVAPPDARGQNGRSSLALRLKASDNVLSTRSISCWSP
jgi:hypothetical protein